MKHNARSCACDSNVIPDTRMIPGWAPMMVRTHLWGDGIWVGGVLVLFVAQAVRPVCQYGCMVRYGVRCTTRTTDVFILICLIEVQQAAGARNDSIYIKS